MLRNLSIKPLRQFNGARFQSTLPSLNNLNASWNTMSTEEKQAVYTDVVERQKQDWKELSVDEKRAGGLSFL